MIIDDKYIQKRTGYPAMQMKERDSTNFSCLLTEVYSYLAPAPIAFQLSISSPFYRLDISIKAVCRPVSVLDSPVC